MENFTVHPGSAHSISFPGSAHVPTRLSHLLPDGPRTPATRRPLPCSNRARRQLTRGRDTAYRSGPDPMPAPRRVASSPSNPPFLCFLRTVQKRRRPMPPHPFRPHLLSSLAAHPEPSHPSPSTAHPRQRPRLGHSSLLAVLPPRPCGELCLPGFLCPISSLLLPSPPCTML
jgi:hypothetical protein